MGDPKLKTLSMARRELEDLYLGIPDDSVNLTFGDLAVPTSRHQQHVMPSSEEKQSKLDKLSSLSKLPSLDFSKAMQASKPNHYHRHVGHDDDSIDSPTMNYVRRHHHLDKNDDNDELKSFTDQGHCHRQSNLSGTNRDNPDRHHHYMNDSNDDDNHHQRNHHHRVITPTRVGYSGFKHGEESMNNFDDVSGISMASNVMSHRERGGRRRLGIPHSNICTLCSTYIYVFRHRCLVCGRVYCRNCVGMGMGEMSEGRKCVECLGKRFSQRYIQRAGKVGCWSRYPAKVKQAELKWADKGPRGSGDERGYGASMMMSTTPRSPIPTMKESHSVAYNHSNSPSFVMSSSFAPYSPSARHTLPF